MEITSIGIIGYGHFGAFLHSLALTFYPHITVRISSSRIPQDATTFFTLEDTCKTDLLILAVPIQAFAATVEKIKPHLLPHTIVCDVATVKKHTATTLSESGIPRFIATHPMFGPYSYEKHGNSLRDLRIALCDHTLQDDEIQAIRSFLKGAGLHVLEMSPDSHDKLVAETLFLTHLVGQTVHQGGFERTSIDTVSFGFLMDAVESVAQDEALFQDVFAYNPYCKDVLERFEASEMKIAEKLSATKFPLI